MSMFQVRCKKHYKIHDICARSYLTNTYGLSCCGYAATAASRAEGYRNKDGTFRKKPETSSDE
jgi:hypothetical protein